MIEEKKINPRSLENLKPFQPGKSGNPGGRPKSKILSDAYKRRLTDLVPNDPEGRTYAEFIAARVVLAAAGGDMQAAKELADRTEGKPKQTVQLSFERRERLEAGVQRIIEESGCGREEAITTLGLFEPDALALLHIN